MLLTRLIQFPASSARSAEGRKLKQVSGNLVIPADKEIVIGYDDSDEGKEKEGNPIPNFAVAR
jgi:hypothetical protein